jgi:hypothetical protein
VGVTERELDDEMAVHFVILASSTGEDGVGGVKFVEGQVEGE